MKLKFTAFSHIGRGSGQMNGDTGYAPKLYFADERMPFPRSEEIYLNGQVVCALSDGMGGHPSGEVASSIAIDNLRYAKELATADSVAGCINKANEDLYGQMKVRPSLSGMGATIAGIVFHPDRLICFNVGDTRVYRLRDGFLSQLTIDDRPPGSTGSGKLTQALGGHRKFTTIEPHVSEHKLPCPSAWLLCTDGVSDFLKVEQMEKCLARSEDTDAVRTLYEDAIRGGSRDDISIILVKLHEGKTARGATNFYW